MNNISSQTYEGTFIKKDIPSYLDIKGFFEFIKKCFEKTNNYSVNFEVSESKLLLEFNTILDFMNINHRLILRELILSNDRLTTTKINQLRLENLELKRQLNEILSEKIFIICRPEYKAFNKYITELDLSEYNNNNDIIWANLPKLCKLEKLIINNSKMLDSRGNQFDTDIFTINKYTNTFITYDHTFIVKHFNKY